MPERLFFDSKWIFLERAIKHGFEILSRDVFLCFAGFFWEDSLYNRRWTWQTRFGETERKDFCSFGKIIGTLGEYRDFMW